MNAINWEKITYRIDKIANIDPAKSDDIKLRTRTFVVVCLLFAFLTAWLSGAAIYLYGWSPVRWLGVIVITMYLCSVMFVRIARRIDVPSHLMMSTLTVILILHAQAGGGLSGIGAPLFIAVPFAAAFFIGARAASIYTTPLLIYCWYAAYATQGQANGADEFLRAIVYTIALISVYALCVAFVHLNRIGNRQLATTMQEVEAARERITRVAENVPNGVFEYGVDLHGHHSVCYANTKAVEMLGVPADDLRADGLNSLRNVHDDDKEALTASIADAVDNKQPWSCDYRVVGPDGQISWLSGASSPTTMPDGTIVWHGAITDITELKRTATDLETAKREAEAANTAKSTFLANMSHEIRTPLNGLLGMAQALSQDNLPPSAMDKLSTLRESGDTLLAILNDILDLSRIEAGRLELATAPTDVRDLLDSTQKLWAPIAQEKGLDFALTIEGDLAASYALDPVRVRQCLNNLVSNAIKFTQEGGVRIEVKADQQPDNQSNLSIAVKDSGIGIDPEALKSLFRPFTQAEPSTTRRFGGTGLGLSISRQLASMMGGGIEAASVPGQGSTFTFHFPAEICEARQLSQQAQNGIIADNSPYNLRILIVDDNAINRQVAEIFVSSSAAVVDHADNGISALEKIEAETYDVVLLDIHMPEMDGIETIGHIRRLPGAKGALPVVALTADAMEGDAEKYLSIGMDAYVPKPIDAKALATAMSTAIAHRQSLAGSPRLSTQRAVGGNSR